MRVRLSLGLVLLGLLPWAGQAQPAVQGLTPRILQAVADPWCPYNCDPASSKPGLMVEALQQALQPYGYTIHYTIVPWKRALEGTLDGTYDIAIAADAEEGAKLRLPAVGFACSYGAFTKADRAFDYKGVSSLEGRRVGGTKGYYYGAEMEAYLQAHRGNGSKAMLLTGTNTLQRNLLKLQHGRLDILLENPYVLNYGLTAYAMPFKVTQVAELVNNTCYHALSPNQPDSAALQALLGQRLKAMEADGTLGQLRAKYGL